MYVFNFFASDLEKINSIDRLPDRRTLDHFEDPTRCFFGERWHLPSPFLLGDELEMGKGRQESRLA